MTMSLITCNCLVLLLFLAFFFTLSLSFEARNPEVEALIGIREGLDDPHGALSNWDEDSVDPCSWSMITCNSDNLVTALGAPSQGLSGSLSWMIANLTNLKQVRLNNNSLSGAVPLSLASLPQLTFLDLSFNNLSGPVPNFPAKTFNILGNPLICGSHSSEKCSESVLASPLSFSVNPSSGRTKLRKLAIALGVSLTFVTILVPALVFLLRRRNKNRKQSILNITDFQEEDLIRLGNLRSFTFKELQHATDNFISKNILGAGDLAMFTGGNWETAHLLQ
ncbi:UNVERIFIED_CONTAM: putative LRR receptor-like serine/threonine-protein kinase [Sesamum latifolium]|uniref:LRR receptor-like serine/threonine-protein kinase n=1 Tax=Sesamum latifolium TaxID=2727402 RepID=A0AAW2XK03_9LAMI